MIAALTVAVATLSDLRAIQNAVRDAIMAADPDNLEGFALLAPFALVQIVEGPTKADIATVLRAIARGAKLASRRGTWTTYGKMTRRAHNATAIAEAAYSMLSEAV